MSTIIDIKYARGTCIFFLSLLTDMCTNIGIVHRVSQTRGECSENEERYPPLRARDLYNCTGCLGQGAGRYARL